MNAPKSRTNLQRVKEAHERTMRGRQTGATARSEALKELPNTPPTTALKRNQDSLARRTYFCPLCTQKQTRAPNWVEVGVNICV